MEKTFSILKNARKCSGFLIALTLPLPIQISRPFLVIFIVLGILDNMYSHFYTSKKFKRFWPLLLFPILFLVQVLSFLFFTENTREGLYHLEKYLPILLIPFAAMGLDLDENDYRRVYRFFICGCILCVILSFIIAMYNSISWVQGHFSFDARMEKDPRIDFWRSINWGGNYFFSNGLSVFHHPTYLSMYLLLGLGIMLIHRKDVLSLMPKVVIAVVFIVTIFLLSSRASQLFLMLLPIGLLITMNHAKKKLIFIVMLLAGTLILALFNPRMQELTQKISQGHTSVNPSDRSSLGARIMVWSSAVSLIQTHTLQGVGLGDLRDVLAEEYAANSFQYPLEHRFNAHNDYLETWATLGLTGFAILVLIHFNGLKYALSSKNWLFLFFMALIVFHGLFESTLQRYSGIVFITFFYSVLMIKSIQLTHDSHC